MNSLSSRRLESRHINAHAACVVATVAAVPAFASAGTANVVAFVSETAANYVCFCNVLVAFLRLEIFDESDKHVTSSTADALSHYGC